jgi:hypothetical protein
MMPSTDPVPVRRPAKAARKELRDRALGLPVGPPEPVTATVRCNGGLHHVVFDGQHLHLPDHPEPDLSRWETLFEMGNRGCRCLEVREAWREGVRSLVPRLLLSAFRWQLARYRARQDAERAWLEAAADADTLRLFERWNNPRTVRAVQSALEHCDYRSADAKPGLRISLGRRPFAEGNRRFLTFQVGYGWYRTVFQAGLAVVDGRLVLAVLTEEELCHRRLRQALGLSVPDRWWLPVLGETPNLAEGPYVLAVYQGRGCTLRPRLARVVSVTGPDGTTRRVLRPCAVRKEAGQGA